MSRPVVRFVSCGDCAIAVHFDERPSAELAGRIAALHNILMRERLPGLVESVPGVTSLTAILEPDAVARDALECRIRELLDSLDRERAEPPERRIPVCYEGELAPDLESVSRACNLAADQVIAMHTSRAYTVYLLGFSPGFPYMGEIDPCLALPRRAQPRARVRAGSVAIANAYTAIYPQETAGGWHLIGATPLALFDPRRSPPALLAPGERVRFEPIDRAEYDRMLEQRADDR